MGSKRGRSDLGRQIHLERLADDNRNRARCLQCGGLYSGRACGPTHAVIHAERKAARAARRAELVFKPDPTNEPNQG